MATSQILGPAFFCLTSFSILLISTIFLALIEGHVKKELEFCREILEPDDHQLHRVVWKILSNYWQVV